MMSSPSPSTWSRVRLYFRGEKLPAGASQVVLHEHQRFSKRWVLLGATEHNGGESNDWVDSIDLDFHFESRQDLKALINTVSGTTVAEVSFQLSHVVASRGSTLALQAGESVVVITAVTCTVNRLDTIRLQFSARALCNGLGKAATETYFRFARMLPNGATKELYQSRLIKGTNNPVWEPTPPLSVMDLVDRNTSDRVLFVECWSSGLCVDSSLGQALFALDDLLALQTKTLDSGDEIGDEPRERERIWDLIKTRKGLHVYGKLLPTVVERVHVPTFSEMLGLGLNVNVAVSIDFTASNGDPSRNDSLHAIQPHHDNLYMRAIRSVCDVLLEYDTDKLVPVYGFGAQLPSGLVSQCFHLNGQQDPNVSGLEGIMKAYASALRRVKLSGPTNFAPSIREAERVARQTPNTYTVLLILTDGCITDTDDTIDAIVACGDAPLSIVIVGVGSADFKMMNLLDGDDERLTSSRGVRCLRDLVQFVPYRDFVTAPREVLAAEVLEEVPRQVEEWAQIAGLDVATLLLNVDDESRAPDENNTGGAAASAGGNKPY